jgi:hypothetical protein
MRSSLHGSSATVVAGYESSINRKMENTESIADIYTSVKPLLQVSMLFGLTPVSVTKKNKCRHEVLQYRLLFTSLFVIWTLGLFTTTCYSIYSVVYFASNIPEKIKVTFILNNISLTSTNFVVLIRGMCYNKRHIIRMFKKMRNVDGIIER